jgi:hypothetical protein
MPFGTITSQTVDFAPRSPGIYTDDSVTFGNPTNEYRIRPATAPNKDGNYRSSITRVLEKDLGDPAVRKACVVTLSINIPNSGFTSTEVDSLATDISTFLTADTVGRILQGEA